MGKKSWAAVDDYIVASLFEPDPVLDAVLAANHDQGLPPIDVSPAQGKLLSLFARMQGAKRILEIGTLGGYSTIWMARAAFGREDRDARARSASCQCRAVEL